MSDTHKAPIEALAATIADFKATPSIRGRTKFAQDSVGRSVSPTSPGATCWCALGRYAFHRGIDELHPFELTGRELFGDINKSGIIWKLNDDDRTLTGEAILPVLEKALEDLKAREAEKVAA